MFYARFVFASLGTNKRKLMAKTSKAELEKKFAKYVRDIGNPKGGIEKFASTLMTKYLICETPAFHKELYGYLRGYNKMAIAAPRSFAKTTVVDVIYPCYLGLLNIPNRNNIAIFSGTQSLSVEQLKKIKHEFDTNKKLIQTYYQIWGMMPHGAKETWKDDEARLSNGVIFQARGAGGQTRGRRPNVVICDDLETTDGVRSSDQRKNLDEWFRKDILGLLEPDAQLVVVGTILHYASLLKCIITEMKHYGWFTKIYQAYIGGVQKAGNELWAEKWSHEQLQQRKKEQGSSYFSSEYMNEPVDDATAPIRTEHLRNWTEMPEKYNMVMAVDPAYSEDEKADWKTCSLIACDSKNNRYLVKYIRTHSSQIDFFNAIANMWQLNRHYVRAIGAPNQGVEKAFFSAFVKFMEERNMYPQ